MGIRSHEIRVAGPGRLWHASGGIGHRLSSVPSNRLICSCLRICSAPGATGVCAASIVGNASTGIVIIATAIARFTAHLTSTSRRTQFSPARSCSNAARYPSSDCSSSGGGSPADRWWPGRAAAARRPRASIRRGESPPRAADASRLADDVTHAPTIPHRSCRMSTHFWTAVSSDADARDRGDAIELRLRLQSTGVTPAPTGLAWIPACAHTSRRSRTHIEIGNGGADGEHRWRRPPPPCRRRETTDAWARPRRALCETRDRHPAATTAQSARVAPSSASSSRQSAQFA